MMHVYEFEVFEDEGMLLAFPYDMDGGTQGESSKEACEMAADWLQMEMEYRDMCGLPFPEATFDNKPQHKDGKTVIVAVNAGKNTIRRMTGSEAAKRLGVSRARVSQMINAGLLDTFELDGRRWVIEDSVNARLAEAPKPGRPKKATTV